jgi:hypothetical protein
LKSRWLAPEVMGITASSVMSRVPTPLYSLLP